MPRRRQVVSGQPITAMEIDKRFAELEEFASRSWSNLAIVDLVRKLRGDVRVMLRMDERPREKPVKVDEHTRWG